MITEPEIVTGSDHGPHMSAVCRILDMCSLPSFCVSADGRIMCANKASGESSELIREKFLGHPADVIDPRLSDWPGFFARLQADYSLTVDPIADQTDPGVASRAIQAQFWQPLGVPLAVISLRDVHDEVEQWAGMARRDEILQAMSRAASRYLADDDWDASCNALLKDLGEATGVSRVYIFEAHYDDDNHLLFSQRYEWVAQGITPQIDNPELQEIPLEAAGFARWQDLLSRGRLVAGQVRDFPESEQELLKSQSILSLAVVPIFTGTQWWGMMGFDECSAPRDWGVAETEALRTVAGLFGLAAERRSAAREAREKRDSMAHEARLVAMGEMASSLAHEINQPLSAVRNYCETGIAALETGSADPAVLERAFRGATTQAQRAGEIIHRLREFVSKGDTTRSYIHLSELIAETLGLISHDARNRGISIVNEAASDLPAVFACRVQIQQVLFNLVRNAIEAISDSGSDSQSTVIVRSELINPHLQRISVLDTGPGVDPKLASFIFEPFETSKEGGMGLGLSLSRTIVEAHGGSLSMDGAYRGGACFHVNLPGHAPDDNA